MNLASSAVRDGNVIYSRLSPIGERETVGAMLARNAARLADHAMYGVKQRDGQFHRVTWGQCLRDVVTFGRFLSEAGVGPNTRVVSFSPNRGETLVVELATMCLGATYVPIFAGYPAAEARDLIEYADPTVLVVPGQQQIMRACVPQTVRVLITLDPLADGEREAVLAGTRAAHTTFAEVLERGAGDTGGSTAGHFLDAAKQLDPSTPCLMMYTSGTSGRMKGVVLTHDNILSQQRSLAAIWNVTPEDRLLSYLPWHHSFGGIFEKYTALYNGATLFIDDSLGKDTTQLLANWMDIQPTIYFSVPQIYQQLVVHAQTHAEDESRIFHPGLRFVFTAAASLPANLSAYFAAKRIPVIEGWGLTETSPCCTVTDLMEPRSLPGMVGYPIPGVKLGLAADGEILVKGPNVMRGYDNDSAATLAVLPGDGWFHTGDLGEFVGTGLKLITRKDRVFKMLNAEKIVPTEIENRLAGMNSFIRHVIVAGDGRRFLAALIYPDYFRIAEQFGDDRATAERVVKESFRETILQFNRERPAKYERIEAFAVVARELSLEARELTPSMKVRVRNVLQNAEGYLEAIYEPTIDCDCRFMRKVMRLTTDERPCFTGQARTLDRCHECGSFVFGDTPVPISGSDRTP